MANRISPGQAAMDALAAYLSSALTPSIPGLIVEPRWPDRFRDMPQKIVTVIHAGPAEWTGIDPYVTGAPVLVSGNLYTYRYTLGELSQQVQLDAWSLYDLDRDDMIIRIRDVMNVGGSQLAGLTLPADPVDVGLMLNLAGEWSNAIAYYEFESFTRSGDDSRESHYRASSMGVCNVPYSISVTVPKLSRVVFKQKVSPAGPLLFTSIPNFDITYITSTGETYGVGP